MAEPFLNEPAASPRILVLTAGGGNPWMIINHLAKTYPGIEVIEENPESKGVLLRRRIRRFGVVNATGQLVTMVVSRLGKRFAARRLSEIAAQHGLSMELNASVPVHHVETLNDETCHELIARLAPAVVVTVSCRILSRATLAAIPCPVINLHSGINPAYRGQMGAYWALVSGDARNFGATVHLVDAGVDTGATLYEVWGAPSKSDTMLTYPALLTALAAPHVARAVEDALSGRLAPRPAESGPSKLWFNVPIWTWAWHGLTKGIW